DTMAGLHGAEPSEQVAALLIELETVFVAGAFVATIVLAAAIVEAQLRQRTGAGPMLAAGLVFADAGGDEALDWLRHWRNRLLHPSNPPALTPDMFWFQADELEAEAQRAVDLVVRSLTEGMGR